MKIQQLVVWFFGWQQRGTRLLPNNSLKPNLLRYTKHMAERACHGFGSTTQVGLTQVLGRKEQRQAGAVAPESVSSSRRSSSLAFGLFPAARDSPAVRALGFGFFAAGHAVGWPASWSKPWLGQGSGGQFVAARRRSWLRGRPKQEACVPLPVVACCGLTVHSSRTRFAGRLNSGVRRRTKTMKWPNRDEREKFEIDGPIEAYERLPESRRLAIVSKGEKPDWIVADIVTGEEIGVELTSVYLDDRSVPDKHMNWGDNEQTRHIPYSK